MFYYSVHIELGVNAVMFIALFSKADYHELIYMFLHDFVAQ